MVDIPGYQTNTEYLTDFIHITLLPKRVEVSYLIDLYVNKGLSGRQIADLIGTSKQMVLSRLRTAGIKNQPLKGRSPNNYRFRNPPYGYNVVDGRLSPNRNEMKVVKLMISFRDGRDLPWNQVARELNTLGHKTRKQTPWGHFMVQTIYQRWKGKV